VDDGAEDNDAPITTAPDAAASETSTEAHADIGEIAT
jgi:hypothetical protein